MLMTDFTELLMTTNPCKSGLDWYNDISKNFKTTNTFFNHLKKTVKPWYNISNISENPKITKHHTEHSYIIYMFRMMIDWSEEIKNRPYYGNIHYCHFNYYEIDNEYVNFLQKHFHVNDDFNIPVPELCDALKRAFK